MKEDLNNKSFDDSIFNDKRTFSPTPTPRRKIMNNYYLNQTQQSDSSNEKNEQDKLILIDQSSIISDSTMHTSSSKYMSSTMPIPRKPRKKSLECCKEKRVDLEKINQIINIQTSNCKFQLEQTGVKNELLPYDSAYYLTNLVYGFENFAKTISSGSNSTTCSTRSNPTNNTTEATNSDISALMNDETTTLATLETRSKNLSRTNTLTKMKRPTAPPPPLPKTPPPLIPPPSPTQFITINETALPRMTSTPHLSNTINTGYLNERERIRKLLNNIQHNQNAKNHTLKQKILAADRNNKHQHHSKNLGFEHLNKIKPKSTNYLMNKIETNERLGLIVSILGCILFLVCICFIVVFQTQVHQFYSKFSSSNNSASNSSNSNYQTAGSYLVKQTLLICNGPYFSYQMNNLLVLPFSLTLVIIFSFFSKREKGCIKLNRRKNNKFLSEMSRRPGLPSSINPFQRQNRFLMAALFCILANEIFKMIESSMFASESTQISTENDFLNSIFNKNDSNFSIDKIISNKFLNKFSSNSDFLRIGLGLEPSILTKSENIDLHNKISTSTSKQITTSKPIFIMSPSVLRYSKPKLPPRLLDIDFEETTTTTTTKTTTTTPMDEKTILYKLLNQSNNNQNDINMTLLLNEKLKQLRLAKNETNLILQSFNQSLNGSSDKTLFEVSMSLYQNEYVQNAINKVFQSQFRWSLITDKLKKLGFMMIEVMIIGMRYYPMLGVLDKNSIVCLCLACLYMWADIFYNVTLIGLCEGLRLNINLDLLKDIRRIFGVGFIDDAKSYIKNSRRHEIHNDFSIDTNLLFSTNRIIYAIVKSLPHFFCLSYVTIRLTVALILLIRKKLNKYSFVLPPFLKKSRNEVEKDMNKSYAYYEKNLIIESKLKKDYNLIYTKKNSNFAHKISDIYSKIVIEKQDDRQTYLFRKYPLSFEDRYVKKLFKNNNYFDLKYKYYNNYNKLNKIKNILLKYMPSYFDWINDEYFRFSTRMVCTYTVCFTVLYYLTCFVVFYGDIFIDMIYLPPIYKKSIILSALITSMTCLIQLILSMKQFKLHLTSLYKGTSNKYLSPKKSYSNNKIATSSFNYAGYAVTYTCWGYVILLFLLSFVAFQVATFIYFGSSTIALFLMIILIPFAISVLIIKLLNRFICSLAAKYFFLQKKSKVLALKNLKLYSLFIYFKFFYDCFAGIAFCMIRMLTSFVLSIVFLPRLDYSFMGRSMEKMDNAFMSYIGYLHWEAHHTNPIAICFCTLLKRFIKLKHKFKLSKRDMLKNRVRTRWYLLCLLAKNKQLIKFRKHNLKN